MPKKVKPTNNLFSAKQLHTMTSSNLGLQTNLRQQDRERASD